MAKSNCGSFQAAVPGPALDLAPPAGFIEICGKDKALCEELTSGYPPSVKTVGYFLTPLEWQRYRQGRSIGFTRYLIAQVAGSTSPSEFSKLKNYIRSRQGDIPDSTDLPPSFNSSGQSNLGVFEDTNDAIAIGVIMKLQSAKPKVLADVVMASTNIAFVTKKRLLSLYVFVDVTSRPRAAPAKQLTREWLQCLRSAK
ncbi:MAG: hypothetical protein H7Y37_13690 [Anaerolineae bacterium]|nr:hypothetical protein [Gloeobacterales cyanobacterium ES-bin-313]